MSFVLAFTHFQLINHNVFSAPWKSSIERIFGAPGLRSCARNLRPATILPNIEPTMVRATIWKIPNMAGLLHLTNVFCLTLTTTVKSKRAWLLPTNIDISIVEIEEIRKDKDGNDLPNARRITRRLVSNQKKTSSIHSALLMAFGQFMDHDLTQTPVFRGNDGSFLNCCQFFPLPKVMTLSGFLRGL